MKKAIIFVFLLAFAFSISAEIIKETPFSESGYQDFAVQEKDSFLCQNIIFPQELSKTSSEFYHFLSLHAEFSPTITGNAQVQIVFGEDINKFFFAKDFQNGWIRLLLPREKLQEKNTLIVCAKASDSIAEVKILSDSKTGTYLSPEIIIEKIPETFYPLTGEEIKLKINLTNKGSEETFVSLKHKKPSVEYDQIEITSGKSFFDGIVEPGETITLDYSVKTVKTTEVMLPAAIATFTNIFGEKETIYSNYPIIYILSNDEAIRPIILLDNALVKAGTNVEATLAVKNNSIALQQNVVTQLELPAGISVQGARQFAIDSLAPGETRYFKFVVSSSKVGRFDLGCTSTYLQKEIVQQKCPITTITFESTEPNYAIMIGVGFLLLGIVIYAAMYFRK
ncbi:MAG: hypothetical protein Q7S21_05295 [archaeon]|nr:hypothetical protein [archaeon]